MEERSTVDNDFSAFWLTPYAIGGYFWVGNNLDNPLFWWGVPAAAGLALVAWLAWSRRGLTELLRWSKQSFCLMAVARLAVGIPAASMIYATELFPAATDGWPLRIPTQRLVDWVDQAILYLHIGREETSEAPSPEDQEAALLTTLKAFGIRTTTDLEAACSVATTGEPGLEPRTGALQTAFAGDPDLSTG